jgi:hypothetical protein
MSANAEATTYTLHALDFRHEGVAVKTAAGLSGALMKFIAPQITSADYTDIDYSIPFTNEALVISGSIEAVGFAVIVATIAASKYFQLANTNDMVTAVLVGGGAIYGLGRTMSLGVEAGNRFARENKKVRLERQLEEAKALARPIRDVFDNPQSEITFDKDVVLILKRNAVEASAATGLKFEDETTSATNIFEFKVKKTARFEEEATVNNFTSIFQEMLREKDSPIKFYSILNRFDRHRKIYEQLGFEKKGKLKGGKEVLVLNSDKIVGIRES